MRNSQKTRKQLISELQETRQQLQILAASEVERRQAEIDLQKSEDRFHKAFRTSPAMIIIGRLSDSSYIEVNESFVKYTGFTREEFIGHNVNEFGMWPTPEDQERFVRTLDEDGRIDNEEFIFRIKSGEMRTWLCSVELIEIDGEDCMIAVATDVTERKLAEEALRKSEEKFSKVFEAVPYAISITRRCDGVFIEVNDTASRYYGYTREEMLGHTAAELKLWLEPEDRDVMLRRLDEKGRIYNDMFDFVAKSGEVRTLLFSAEPITIGGEDCVIVVQSDITDLKYALERNHVLDTIGKTQS